MEPYELVEEFEKFWAISGKNFPFEGVTEKDAWFSLFVRAGELRVHIMLVVGVRGGISETVTAIDPSLPVMADRLIVDSTDGGEHGEGILLQLYPIRSQVWRVKKGRRELAIKLCREALRQFVEKLDNERLSEETVRLLPSTSHSLKRVYFGGAASLGKGGYGGSGR